MGEQDDELRCPICGSAEECEHYLAWDDFLSEFADGVPAQLAERLAAVDDDERPTLAAAPSELCKLFVAASPDEYGDASIAYWTDYPGVATAFFAGDRPGGSGVSFYHADGQAFTERVRREAQAGITWLDAQLPALRERATGSGASG